MIKILVDSSSEYIMEEIKANQMELIPISISLGEKAYMDGIDLNRSKFYELLINSKEFPKTSQPSPQAFLDIFKNAKQTGDSLICILLSSALSGTFQSAVLAKNMVDYDGIYLIDSRSAAVPIKVMAQYACRLRDEGLSAKEIAEKMEEFKPKVRLLAALDTLEYLAKGGRLNRGVAAIGDMANIKPIITLSEEGEVKVLGKALGRNKAIHHLLQQLAEFEIDTQFPIYTIYTYGTDNCSKFEDQLTGKNYSIGQRMQIGPTIGTHIGPEAFGMVFVRK
ncbi:MAG: DegV family protein [Lachnoclostridium sp.]|nr:DegV family protein [Lachnospira sp.]MCM1247548.1 DegV family protein [Lachnoclostridium sp.]